MLASLLLAALPAFADEPTDDPTPETPGPETPGPDAPAPDDPTAGTVTPMPEAPAPAKARNFLMEVNFRGRYMFVPESILDIWYFKELDGAPTRPGIAAYSLGLEYVVKDEKDNGIFYVEYINPLMDEGYWDDRESDETLYDGSWIAPDKFGLVAIGADYGRDLKVNKWFSFIFGAGLGVGIKVGNLVEWQPGEPEGTVDGDNVDPTCGQLEPAYQRKDHCANDGNIDVPPAIPMVDVNLGIRFNFNDRSTLRIEGGLHDLPYGGAAVGIVF